MTPPDPPPHPQPEPVPVPVPAEPVELDYGRPERKFSRVWPLLWLYAGVATCLIGTFFILLNVESVLASGPTLFTIGTVLLILGLNRRQRWLTAAGAMHVGICILFFGLVQVLSWSPQEAQQPFGVMSVVHTLAALAVSWVAVRQAKQESDGVLAPQCGRDQQPVAFDDLHAST